MHGDRGSRWRTARGLPPAKVNEVAQKDQFIELVLKTRARLQQLYAQALPVEQMRERKAQEFQRLRDEYHQMQASQWAGDKRYDAWINAPLNNAKLLPFGLYDQWVPAFAALFKQVNGDWPSFFKAVEKLGGLPVDERKAALRKLMPG